jgi:hypothetical protein
MASSARAWGLRLELGVRAARIRVRIRLQEHLIKSNIGNYLGGLGSIKQLL